MWEYVKLFTCTNIPNYESLACKWLCEKKDAILNIVSAGFLWGLWLTRNDLVFHNDTWQDIRKVLRRIRRTVSTWKPMYSEYLEVGVTQWCVFLETTYRAPLELRSS
jgi:hypothetical protein